MFKWLRMPRGNVLSFLRFVLVAEKDLPEANANVDPVVVAKDDDASYSFALSHAASVHINTLLVLVLAYCGLVVWCS